MPCNNSQIDSKYPVPADEEVTNWDQLTTGQLYTMGIIDGKLYAWGDNSFGRTGLGISDGQSDVFTQVGEDNNWQMVAASAPSTALASWLTIEARHTLGIKGGNLYGWGSNIDPDSNFNLLGMGEEFENFLEPTLISDSGMWEFISVSDHGSVGIEDGKIKTTLNAPIGEWEEIDSEFSDWEKVFMGGPLILAIRDGGKLYAWGEESSGNSGTGGESLENGNLVQVSPGEIENWKDIGIGSEHSVGITHDGKAYAWGSHMDGATTHDSLETAPVRVGEYSNWVACDASLNMSILVNSNGDYLSFGNHLNALTGVGILDANSSTTGIPNLSNISFITFKNVSVGYCHASAIVKMDPEVIPDETNSIVNATGPHYVDLEDFSTVTIELKDDNGNNIRGIIPNDIEITINISAEIDEVEKVDEGVYESKIYGLEYGIGAITVTAYGMELLDSPTVEFMAPSGSLIYSWGANSSGKTGQGTESGETEYKSLIVGVTSPTQIVSHSTATLILDEDGDLYRTGRFDTLETRFVKVSEDKDWKTIEIGGSGNDIAFFGIKNNGTLWSWGSNSLGKTGLGSSTGVTETPTQVGTKTNWTKIVASSAICIALDDDGDVYTWGTNTSGATGLGTTEGITTEPTKVETLSNVTDIAANAINSFALVNGEVYGTGRESEIGDGEPENLFTDLITDFSGKARDLTNINSIFASSAPAIYALDEDNYLYAWGSSSYNGIGEETFVPEKVNDSQNWEIISANNSHTLALQNNNGKTELWSWGANFFGELGTGDTVSHPEPIKITDDVEWKLISAGNNCSFASIEDGD